MNNFIKLTMMKIIIILNLMNKCKDNYNKMKKIIQIKIIKFNIKIQIHSLKIIVICLLLLKVTVVVKMQLI